MTPPTGSPSVVPPIVDTLVHHLTREHPRWRLPAHRDAHPKHHLVVAAEFIVDNDLPDRFRHGVLATPGGRFQAWVRFSNALKVRHDLERDARGMAVKLLGVHGERPGPGDAGDTQDFLAVTHKAFFARTAADFLDFTATVLGHSALERFARVFGYFFSLRPLRVRWRGFVALQRSMQWAWSPLVCRYFSQTPYRLGPDLYVKFAIVPREAATSAERRQLFCRVAIYHLRCIPGLPWRRWRRHLRKTLLTRLAAREATFDFMVQERVTGPGDPMPLDDATVIWDETLSPYRKVATIHFPVQHYTMGQVRTLMRLGEHLSYSPWHTLTAHLPVGSINEARRVVYDAISRHRHRLNAKSRREPRGGESPEEYLGSL